MSFSTSTPAHNTINTDQSNPSTTAGVITGIDVKFSLFSTFYFGFNFLIYFYLFKPMRENNHIQPQNDGTSIACGIASIIFFIAFLICFLNSFIIIIKFCLSDSNVTRDSPTIIATRGHATSAATQGPEETTVSQGQNAANIVTNPAILYCRAQSNGIEECVICLSSLDGGLVRLLPNCIHIFHVDCIDKWLHLCSTCPLCRRGMRSSMF